MKRTAGLSLLWKGIFLRHKGTKRKLKGKNRVKMTPEEEARQEMASRLESYQAYSVQEHGPLYCMDSLSRELMRLLHPSRDHANKELIRLVRGQFGETIWGQVGTPNGPVSATNIPVYHLYDHGFRRWVGFDAAQLSKWLLLMRTAAKNVNAPEEAFSKILDDLHGEATTRWAHVKKVSHSNWISLKDYLRTVDRLGNLRDYYDQTVEELNKQGCPIQRFVALDIEAFETAPRKLTEFGITVYDLPTGDCNNIHIIIKEHEKLRNKKFAKDAKDRFEFGQSVYMRTTEAMKFLEAQLMEPNTALVGHALKSDMKFLERAKVVGGRRIDLKMVEGLPKYDLQHLYRCSRCSEMHSKLETIITRLGLPAFGMHNAGNDAALTMLAFLRLIRMGKHSSYPYGTPE